MQASYDRTGAAPEALTAAEIVATRAAAIVVRFAVFRDGRGFTVVRLLREPYFQSRPIIVAGHVLADQRQQLRQPGASAVLLPTDANPAVWQGASGRFAGTCQPAVADARARRGAGRDIDCLRRKQEQTDHPKPGLRNRIGMGSKGQWPFAGGALPLPSTSEFHRIGW